MASYMRYPLLPAGAAGAKPVVVSAAALQAMAANTAYWVNADGTLTSAATAFIPNTTVAPPWVLDLPPDSYWAVDVGLQTGSTDGIFGLVEVWPTFPAPAAITKPFCRHVASIELPVTGNGQAQRVVERLPAQLVLLHIQTLTNTLLPNTPWLSAGDYVGLEAFKQASALTASGNFLVYDASTSEVLFQTSTARGVRLNLGRGSGAQTGNNNHAGAPVTVGYFPKMPRVFSLSTDTLPGVGIVEQSRLWGIRDPAANLLAHPMRVAPFIAFGTVPTVGAALSFELWGAQ